MEKILWNNNAALREQAKALSKEGFVDAAAGCILRAEKLEELQKRFKKLPKKLLEEPVEA